ncbi:MAG: VOC family protein [Anaerolineae bacterium]|nr:VOC family protein [Anaerolineae bacterium]
MEPKTITYQSSVIFVQDMIASRHFYEALLGQQVDMDFGLNVGFKAGFALWQVDHAFQMIYEHAPEKVGPLGRQNYELYFETADLEAASTRLLEAGVVFLHPLREQPWGQRAFRVYDPDGHIVELGEPMPAVIVRLFGEGMSAKAVAERTGMPLDIVKQIAGK